MEINLSQEKFSTEQLPIQIRNTVNDIKGIEQQISKAVDKAKNAKELADEASKKNAGWSFFGSDKKEAIEALQSAAISQADALSGSVEANKQLYENQKRMSDALRYLFGLGVANIAATRTVVRELQLKLENSSKEELGELARQELYNVILQLRAQEDLYFRLENHDRILKEHKETLEGHKNGIDGGFKYYKKIEKKEKELEEKFEEDKKCIYDDIRKLSDQLSISIDNKVASALGKTEHRLLTLEEYSQQEIANCTFLDSKLYKAIIGIISLSALIISLLNLI